MNAIRRLHLRSIALVPSLAMVASFAQAADPPPWPVIGRQGIVQLIIVPAADVKDRAAYDREIERLCEVGQTCFLNFYANSTGAPVTVPLPDAISNEATATFRRSFKLGAQMFVWSCRLGMAVGECF